MAKFRVNCDDSTKTRLFLRYFEFRMDYATPSRSYINLSKSPTSKFLSARSFRRWSQREFGQTFHVSFRKHTTTVVDMYSYFSDVNSATLFKLDQKGWFNGRNKNPSNQ